MSPLDVFFYLALISFALPVVVVASVGLFMLAEEAILRVRDWISRTK